MVAELILAALKAYDPRLSILSVRKGGLQSMAARGASEALLLHHSRHASTDNLMRYLDWGAYSLYSARERFAPSLVPAGLLEQVAAGAPVPADLPPPMPETQAQPALQWNGKKTNTFPNTVTSRSPMYASQTTPGQTVSQVSPNFLEWL